MSLEGGNRALSVSSACSVSFPEHEGGGSGKTLSEDAMTCNTCAEEEKAGPGHDQIAD